MFSSAGGTHARAGDLAVAFKNVEALLRQAAQGSPSTGIVTTDYTTTDTRADL